MLSHDLTVIEIFSHFLTPSHLPGRTLPLKISQR